MDFRPFGLNLHGLPVSAFRFRHSDLASLRDCQSNQCYAVLGSTLLLTCLKMKNEKLPGNRPGQHALRYIHAEKEKMSSHN